MDLLTGTFMIRQLSPWFENIKKRQVKSPKIYIRDSGIFHSLIGIESAEALRFNPKLGPSWEGFAMEEIIRKYDAQEGESYFWSAYGRAELDLMIIKEGEKLGFEIKHTDSLKVTKSVLIALDDLGIEKLSIVYPGHQRFPLATRVEAVGLSCLFDTT